MSSGVAGKYAAEDAAFKEKVEAKNSLENYCYSMKSTLDDDKVKDKISSDDKEKATKAVDEALSWLEGNQMAEKEEFEYKRKEVEGICTPIMTAMYSQGGGGTWAACPVACPLACRAACRAAAAAAAGPTSRRSTKSSALLLAADSWGSAAPLCAGRRDAQAVR